jgi:hypothetical protein
MLPTYINWPIYQTRLDTLDFRQQSALAHKRVSHLRVDVSTGTNCGFNKRIVPHAHDAYEVSQSLGKEPLLARGDSVRPFQARHLTVKLRNAAHQRRFSSISRPWWLLRQENASWPFARITQGDLSRNSRFACLMWDT